MANYENLKALIAAAIKENGNEEITGQLLQGVLLNLVRVLGDGYQFGGVATPNGSPDISADARAFFLAFQAGTYVNYGGVVMASDGIGIITQGDEWAIISIALSSDIFVAKGLGETTFAQVLAARDAGKAVIAVTPSGDVYTLIGTILSDGSFGFYTIQGSTTRYILLRPNNTWGGPSLIQLQRTNNMVQTIGGGAADKYPSTAAVKTAIDALGSRLNDMPYPLGWFTPAWDNPDDPFNTPLPPAGTYTQAQLNAYGITQSVFQSMARAQYAGIKLLDDSGESSTHAPLRSCNYITGDYDSFARFSMPSGIIWTITMNEDGDYVVTRTQGQ